MFDSRLSVESGRIRCYGSGAMQKIPIHSLSRKSMLFKNDMENAAA